MAHTLAKERRPDWILWIDGDEIFETATTRKDLETYMHNPNLNEVRFRMFNFWLSKTHYRIDGRWLTYTAVPQRQMWRNLSSAYFENHIFHNGGITGLLGKPIVSHIRIKHYGYINKEQIKDKYNNYRKLKSDPRASKTLPIDENTLQLKKWREYKSPFLNRLWQEKEKWSWYGVNVYLSIISQFSQTKG